MRIQPEEKSNKIYYQIKQTFLEIQEWLYFLYFAQIYADWCELCYKLESRIYEVRDERTIYENGDNRNLLQAFTNRKCEVAACNVAQQLICDSDVDYLEI